MTDTEMQRITPRQRDLGDGFTVRRVLPFHARKMVGPFIFFDHFGPVAYAPGKGMDVRPHPHIGLSTVTYLFDGAIRHRDSLGTDLVIRPGAVNWMTAGRGITHSERTPPEERARGQSLHGLQTWLALPDGHGAANPAFAHHPADTLPALSEGGADLRLLAGAAFGHRSPVEFPTGVLYVAVEAPLGGRVPLPADLAEQLAVYAVSGRVLLAGAEAADGEMLVLPDEGRSDALLDLSPGARAVIIGGDAMPKRLIDWNFVASEQALIDEAKRDWRESIEKDWQGTRFSQVPGETEAIPLPAPASPL